VADDRGRRQRAGRLILAVEDDATFAEALVALAHELDFDCVVAGRPKRRWPWPANCARTASCSISACRTCPA
jgi:hypothetical protein